MKVEKKCCEEGLHQGIQGLGQGAEITFNKGSKKTFIMGSKALSVIIPTVLCLCVSCPHLACTLSANGGKDTKASELDKGGKVKFCDA